MKKIFSIFAAVFFAAAVSHAQSTSYVVPAGFVVTEHGISLNVIKTLGITNGFQFGDSIDIKGSIDMAKVKGRFEDVTIIARLDGTILTNVPVNAQYFFAFKLDTSKYKFGSHRIDFIAVGKDPTVRTDPIDRLFSSVYYSVNKVPQMKTGGWIFLIAAWASILTLNVFSFVKIFSIKESKIVEPLELDTEV